MTATYYTFPKNCKKKYLEPEHICDVIQHKLALLDITLSDESYACIWDDVQDRNEKLGLMPMTDEERAAERRKANAGGKK